MATFSNLPNHNLSFTLVLNVQPRCGQSASQVTRAFRRGMNDIKVHLDVTPQTKVVLHSD